MPAMPSSDDLDEMSRRRELQARALELVKAAGVPSRYAAATIAAGAAGMAFSEVPDDARSSYIQAIQRVRQLLAGCGVLALLGPRGVGKTWIACGAVLDLCRQGQPGRYLHVFDYFSGLKETYGDRARTSEARFETDHLRPRLLVLDEMHERSDSPWEDRMLTRLIVKRHDARLSTLLLSNDNLETFSGRVGDSILSRMSEDAGGALICDWRGLRGRS